MPSNQPPYAVAPTEFRFPALAALAGRAQLGGDREVVLAVYLAARLAHDCQSSMGISDAARAERAATAKTWMSTFALPAAVRPVIGRLIESTGGDASALGDDLRAVLAASLVYLDTPARLEVEKLAAAM